MTSASSDYALGQAKCHSALDTPPAMDMRRCHRNRLGAKNRESFPNSLRRKHSSPGPGSVESPGKSAPQAQFSLNHGASGTILSQWFCIARYVVLALTTFALVLPVRAEVPQMTSYQGRVSLGRLPFTGAGAFKFSLISAATGLSVWSNDGTHADGTEPDASVPLAVTNGTFAVLLGDAAVMVPFPVALFEDYTDLQLRVWFNDGTHGFEKLQPDTRLASVPYALNASVPAGSITSAKLAPASIGADKLAPASIGVDKLAVLAAPAAGQVLAFSGAGLSWITAPGGGGSLTLPFSGVGAVSSSLFSIDNTGSDDAWAIFGHSQHSLGVFGQTNGNSSGVLGRSEGASGQGVFGYASDAAVGVLGISENAEGVIGVSKRGSRAGVVGRNDECVPQGLSGECFPPENGGAGVYGYAAYNEPGILGISEYGDGVRGTANRANGSGGHFFNLAGGAALKVEGRLDLNGVLSQHDAITSNDWNIFFRSAGDPMHGVGWHGAGKQWAGVDFPDGPVLWGWAGGALGTTRGGQKSALWWDDTGMVSVKVLTITGGADLAEPFPVKEEKLEPGNVVVIDDEHPGRLKLSADAYDTRVAGVVSGANGVNPGISLHQQGAMEGTQEVALTGRVYVKADARIAPIKPGDLLTTSDMPGHAMKVRDHSRAQGAVLGKAMSALSEGDGLVLVLVTLQ